MPLIVVATQTLRLFRLDGFRLMPVTTRQIDLLAPYLEGDQPTHRNQDGTREWNIVCPLHGDHKRSASLNVDKGLFYCFKCGGMPVTALIRRKAEWISPAAAARNGKVNLSGEPADKRVRVITQAMVDGWHSALMSNPGGLQWLRERRGLNDKTLAQYQIGMEDGHHYTIPIYDENGDLVNIRFYDPTPGSRRKIWSETGYGSPPRLYPISVVNADPKSIGILAGEWDTLLALQYGFVVVTRTAGENTWHSEWGQWFRDKDVWICQDADDEGVRGNRKIARALENVAASIKLVKLPFPIVKKHGPDVTDVIMDKGPDAMQAAIDAAEPWGKGATASTDDIETVTVLDTFDSRRAGKPMRVIVTVKGRKEPGYTIPGIVRFACTQDAGQKCLGCPLNSMSGEAEKPILPGDPIVLALIESPKHLLEQTLADSYGIPGGRCSRLQIEATEHQAVEVLFGRPALDYSDGTKAGEYKNIKVTSVGRHDTMANNTIAFVGALHPNPKDQHNEFLAHELEYLDTAVDRFEINKDTVALMHRFQPRANQRPIKKLAAISKNLSEYVTHIHGRDEMHALMDLTFHSALSFDFAGERILRGWLESLIIGDTRTGKSLAAERLVRHFGGGEIISCEAASFAGVVGGLQQIGGRDWAVTWGVVPINDRRLVVLDEISGLTTEEISAMSDIRSSGQAKLIKIQQETTWARTRLLWLGNPRNATMANYTYGVDAIKPLIGNAEDIARFDLAMALTLYDVPAETINQPAAGGELKYTAEACHALLMWVWTRQPEQIVFRADAERKVFDAANEMGKLYIEDPPLVQAANIRIKIARVAVALAARTFSTDAKHEKIIVTKVHVEDAVSFFHLLYGMETFGYRERSREILSDRLAAIGHSERIEQYLKGRPLLMKHLRNQGKFRRQDLEELLNVTRDEANGIINTLYEARMIRRHLGEDRKSVV